MTSDKKANSYICSSANWDCLVEAAFSPSEAAAVALQKQIDSDSESFSVGASICVTPVILQKDEAYYFYSPSVLADIGLHRFAGRLSKDLEKHMTTAKGKNKKKGPSNES